MNVNERKDLLAAVGEFFLKYERSATEANRLREELSLYKTANYNLEKFLNEKKLLAKYNIWCDDNWSDDI